MTDPKELAQPYEVWEGYGCRMEPDQHGNMQQVITIDGFTKEEVVMKDFMAALLNASYNKNVMSGIITASKSEGITPAELLANEAAIYTAAYFKELNKTDNG